MHGSWQSESQLLVTLGASNAHRNDMTLVQKLLVIGGNGFVGSTVCKAALAKGMQVTSVSLSGEPFRTPKGHTPAWTSKVNWQKGNALQPDSYAHHMSDATAVVHTLGSLFEGQKYKKALKDGNLFGLFASILQDSRSGNPLEKDSMGSYEVINRETALRVCETFLSSQPSPAMDKPRAFVFVSAEDIFRPWIPARYIETKREAESRIDDILSDNQHFRSVHIRPSLIYHPHYRPITSPLAAAIDISSNIHARIPSNFPTPSGILRTFSGLMRASTNASSSFESMANALTTPPIHVDHVAEAITVAANIERSDIRGVHGVREMRRLFGWQDDPQHSYSL